MSLEIIRSLFNTFERAELDPILVGGWAVQHHGYPRNTLDIDFVLCSDDKGLLDIRTLLKYNRDVIDDSDFRELCEKYGPPSAYQLITENPPRQ